MFNNKMKLFHLLIEKKKILYEYLDVYTVRFHSVFSTLIHVIRRKKKHDIFCLLPLPVYAAAEDTKSSNYVCP